MLRNYFQVAVRTLARNKVYSAINVLGLAVGFAVCGLIYLFIQDEVAYDRYHPDADRAYRVVGDGHAALIAPFLPVAADQLPEIDVAARVYPMLWSKPLMRHGESAFYESRVFFVDSSYFDVFGYELSEGDDARSALARPFTVVVTESTARRYFDGENPVGRFMRYDQELEFEVTGVVEDPHPQSHMQFDFLFSFATLYKLEEEWGLPLTWGNYSFHGYVLLHPGVDPGGVGGRLDAVFAQHSGRETETAFALQQVSDIHLNPVPADEFSARSSWTYIYVFGTMALMVLIIACVNFVNLSTARSTMRAREVGMRKALGADRRTLFQQFLGESLLMSLAALFVGLALMYAMLPLFNELSGKQLEASSFGLQDLGILLAVAVIAGSLAGIYPAAVLSRFSPSATLKGRTTDLGRPRFFRHGLVGLQFALAILLLVGTLVASAQLEFLRDQNRGLTEASIVVVPMTDRSLIPRVEALEQELARSPAIASVSTSHRVPGESTNGQMMAREGHDGIGVRSFGIDDDFLETFGVALLAGRAFRKTEVDRSSTTLLINETAVRAFGWSEPAEAVGEVLMVGDQRRTIVGVFEDFNFENMRSSIEPLALGYSGFRMYVSLRVRDGRVNEALEAAETTWRSFSPDFPFEYFLLDEKLDAQYGAEQRIDDLFRSFSLLALLIGCFGLFGLAAFSAQRRTKELGIRKALGATVTQLVSLLSREYTIVILSAWAIASPLAYLGVRTWMQGFAYQAEIGFWPYVAAGLGALLVSWFTVAYQSIKSALVDPAVTLRQE